MLSMKPALNLRQIEAFASVMRTGSVVGAAKLMNVTQPAVSRAVSLLELRIGYKLFERRGRRLVPTPEGEGLFREVEPIYGSLDRIAQATQDIRFQKTGALRIATLPALSQWVVPRAVAGFLTTRPNVSVFVQSLPSRQIAELVATRQCDIGVVELPLSRLLRNVRYFGTAPWFYGHMSHLDANALLFSQPVGTYLVRLSRSERSSLVSQTAALGGEFINATRVTDSSGSLMLNHRLTPLTSATADMTLIRTQADGSATTPSFTNKTRRATAGLSTSFTRRSSGSLTYRHSRATGTTEYTENALLGSVIILF